MPYFLLVSLAYICGILFSEKLLSLNIYTLIGIPFLLLIIPAVIFFLRKGNFLRLDLILISLMCFSACYSGAYWYKRSLPVPQNNDLFYYAPEKRISLEGTIISEPKVNENKVSFKFNSDLVTSPQIRLSAGTSIVTVYSSELKFKYGDKLKVDGKLSLPPDSPNPDEFSYRKYLNNDGIFTLITVNSAKSIEILERGTRKDFQNFILETKEKLLSTFYKTMPLESATMVSSLVFGSKASPVSQEIQVNFTNLGLAHVLAASGMQISLIMVLGMFLTKKLRLNLLAGTLLTSLTIIFYMFLTGFPPSILRAGLLNLIVLFIALKKETADTFKILLLVSIGLTVWSPLILFDIGFQFSVIATFALLYVSPVIVEKLEFLPPVIAEIVAMILSAQVLVLPLQLFYFGQFSYLFLPANIIASIFVDLLTYLAILTLTAGLLIPFLASILGKVLFILVSAFLYCTGLLAKLPFSVSYIARPQIFSVILGYGLIFFIIEYFKRDNEMKFVSLKNLKFISVILILSLGTAGVTYNKFEERNQLIVSYINVEQGDSTLIQTPEGKTILIDCGNSYEFSKGSKKIVFDAAERYIVPYLRHQGINKIDVLVLTHPDSDHIGGYQSLQKNIEIKEVWDSGQRDESTVYNDILGEVLKKEVTFKIVHKGPVYEESNLSLEEINDIKPDAESEHAYNNNNGIGLKLTYGKTSFLFMADLEREAEEKLIENGPDLSSMVLKVGHHGSKNSSTEEFLLRVMPEISVISVGANNRYGHPSRGIVKRLEAFGSKVYRTDKDGGIVIKSDGDKLSVITSN